MTIQEILLSFEKLTNHYVEELDTVSFEQLLLKPSNDEWSLGQMYVHLIQTAQRMQIGNAALCLQANEASVANVSEKTEAGQAMFALGSFPPVRVHVPPSPQYTPLQPESKEQLVQGMKDVLRQMNEIGQKLEGIEAKQTVAHPRLGALNALEWFSLAEMHYRHHLLQEERLKKEFLSIG